MKRQLGMTFKKIKDISNNENSVRSLILRQQFAIKFIELAMRKKRIINIDQTWLGMEDFRKFKWKHPDYSNSIPKKSMTPRISLILALDNFGRSYIALT
jgi:Zn-finger domain-containing protein